MVAKHGPSAKTAVGFMTTLHDIAALATIPKRELRGLRLAVDRSPDLVPSLWA
jgi:hypothetical protein